MSFTISFHSQGCGSGQTTVATNLAALLALRGRRVGLLDADARLLGCHRLLQVRPSNRTDSLLDCLWCRTPFQNAGINAIKLITTESLTSDSGQPACLQLIRWSASGGQIAKLLKDGYDANRVVNAISSITAHLQLDFLLIDALPRLTDEGLIQLASSQAVIAVMRPDNQDLQGAATLLDAGKRLAIPHRMVVINKAPPSMDRSTLEEQVITAVKSPVAAILPMTTELIPMAGRGLFARLYPTHAFTRELITLANHIDRLAALAA